MSALNLGEPDKKISGLKEKLKAARAEAKRNADSLALAVGHALLSEAKDDSDFENQIRPILDRRIRPKRIRAALGLDNEDQQSTLEAVGEMVNSGGDAASNDAPANAGAASVWEKAQTSESNS